MYRAVDQHGQVIDVLVSVRRDGQAARRFFHRALTTLKVTPTEVVTDAAPVYPRIVDELVPAAWHHVERYENNWIEADHSRLKHRLRRIRGLGTDRTAQVVTTGLAFLQNLRRGPCAIATRCGPVTRTYWSPEAPRAGVVAFARSGLTDKPLGRAAGGVGFDADMAGICRMSTSPHRTTLACAAS